MLDAFDFCLESTCGSSEPGLMDDALLLELHRRVGRNLGEVFEAIPGRYRSNNVVVGGATARPTAARCPS